MKTDPLFEDVMQAWFYLQEAHLTLEGLTTKGPLDERSRGIIDDVTEAANDYYKAVERWRRGLEWTLPDSPDLT